MEEKKLLRVPRERFPDLLERKIYTMFPGGLRKVFTLSYDDSQTCDRPLVEMMRKYGMFSEFCDDDNLVMMFSVNNRNEDFERACMFFDAFERKEAITDVCAMSHKPERKMTVRQALFSPSELVDVQSAKGRILADPSVSCPPAIPIAISGEVLDEKTVECFEYYKIKKVRVVKE